MNFLHKLKYMTTAGHDLTKHLKDMINKRRITEKLFLIKLQLSI